MDEQVKRVYSSPLRARQADQTRREIVAAASKLFVSCGYTATTGEAGAAGPDPTLRELHDEKERDHTFGMTNLAGHLDLRQALRDELTVTDAAQLLVAQTDGTIYHRLVIRHGWPTQRFADWLADTLTHQLI